MRRLALAATFVVAGLAAAASAQAMPVIQVAPLDNGITTISGGCGPGGHRGPYGRCYPNYARGYRGCPPGFHPGPYGRCRPNF